LPSALARATDTAVIYLPRLSPRRMGSWNALCITLPDEDDHEAALREMLDAD
jgi:hypothetical protein